MRPTGEHLGGGASSRAWAWVAIVAALSAFVWSPFLQAWHVHEDELCSFVAPDARGAAPHQTAADPPGQDPARAVCQRGSPATHDSAHCAICGALASILTNGSTVPAAAGLPLTPSVAMAIIGADQARPAREIDAATPPRGPPGA